MMTPVACLLSLLTFFSVQSWAQTAVSTHDAGTVKTPSQLQFSLDFLSGAINYVEGQDESQLVLLQLRPQAAYKLSEDFKIKSEVWVSLNSARSQSRFQNPSFNTFNLMELTASYEPSQLFNLSVGAINQGHLGNRMLLADRAFPGAMIESGFKNPRIDAKLKIQHVIPTSTSFESDRTKAEALPGLTTLGGQLQWQPLSWLKSQSDVHFFEFTDLPSVVAFQSGRMGNQVIGVDPSESFFAYDFKGYSSAHKVTVYYSSQISHFFNVSILENSEAPSDRNRSQYVGMGLNFDFEDYRISPQYAQFYAESDSTPALYSGFELGRNNREGQLFGAQFEFKKSGFVIHTNYVKADLITQSPLQREMDYLELILEVRDVRL